MLEIYLFVNPLGMRCIRCEHDLLRIDQQMQQTKLSYHFVPFINLQTIEQTLHLHHLAPTANNRQRVATTLCQVALDYKAALFQGRRRGRQFLLQIQDALTEPHQTYTTHLVQTVAQKVGLDLAMFTADQTDPLTKQALDDDQRIAHELGVAAGATAVVYDSNNPDYGTMINDFDYESLIQAWRAGILAGHPTFAQFTSQYPQCHHKLHSGLHVL